MISQFQEQFRNRHQIGRKWKEQGGKVLGYFYSYIPEELIYAAGILPVQFIEIEGSHERGRFHLEDYTCDYAQSCLDQALTGVYDYIDGVVMSFPCDLLPQVFGIWRRNIPSHRMFFLAAFREIDEHAKLYSMKEWTALKEFLENVAGTKITDQSLTQAIELCNENRALMKKLYEPRLGDNPPISGSEICEVVKAGLIMHKKEHNALLRQLLEGLSTRTAAAKPGIRLFVSAPILEECSFEDANALKIIEEAGGEIVADDFCTGLRYFWDPVEPKPNLLEALVDRYLGKIPCPIHYLAETRIERLLEQALAHRVKGAVFMLHKFCDIYTFEQPLIEEKFREKGIRTLAIETTSQMTAGPLTTRVQAFIESLAGA